ncbi:MAG: hypothetical protein IPL62_12085 [Caulobacteraceae bacterium]|nr:hypothetical protein [Caulobacteraceae bacterium]
MGELRAVLCLRTLSLATLAACGQTTTPATTTETPAEVAATTTGPTNAADATAQDTCGAAAFQSLVGQPATTIRSRAAPSGTPHPDA